MGLLPKSENKDGGDMPLTDVRSKTEVWLVLRRDAGDEASERAQTALDILGNLEKLLSDIGEGNAEVLGMLQQLRALREEDTGYARYHIQGIAVGKDSEESKAIAVTMCRDDTYLIGPLPVNVALPHYRTEWPGLHFPLKETQG